MDDFITVLYEDREDNNAFEVEDSELMEWKKRLEEDKKELQKIIYEKLPDDARPRFDHIILEMQEVERNFLDVLKRSCYAVGIKDGANINTKLKQ